MFTKFWVMKLEVDLFVYFWSWINEIVEYLINKISFKKHNWKTSFKMIIDKKSNLTHIIQYETKTYSLNKNISKKKKMKSKTHFDFLIKYDSINIFFIWVFNQRKVIRTRDVTFDENVRYRFNEIDLTQLINEFFFD